MRRLLLLTGITLLFFHLTLGGITIAGRVSDAAACFQYYAADLPTPIFGVIDAYTGMSLDDRGHIDWQYLYSNEQFSIIARQGEIGYNKALASAYMTYDLATISTDSRLPTRYSYTMLQKGMVLPLTTTRYSAAMLYQIITHDLIVTPGQIAFRWMDSEQHPFLTLVNEDGSNRRIIPLDPSVGLNDPLAWSADGRYILMRTQRAERFKPYAVLDVQTLKSVSLPAELLSDGLVNWQTAAWSPTHAQIAAIRSATGTLSKQAPLVTPLQLVLYTPADGTTRLVDLPPQFYVQEIVWSPTGELGALIGTYIFNSNGQVSQRDYRGYVLFSADGTLKTDVLQGLYQSQVNDTNITRLGIWSIDGKKWLYLTESGTAMIRSSTVLSLVSVAGDSAAVTLLEDQLSPAWWAEVFNDIPRYEEQFGSPPPASRRDLILVTVADDGRFNVDLMDTETLKRTRVLTRVDRLTTPNGEIITETSGLRFAIYRSNSSPLLFFNAIVKRGSQTSYIWSAVDGSNYHELPINADLFELSSGGAFQQPTLLFRLKRDNQSSIGKIDLDSGKQIVLLKALTFADRFNTLVGEDTDRAAFAVTNVLTGPSDLYLSALDGSFSKLLATQILSDPVWSPDGSQLAYMHLDNGRFKIVIVNRDGEQVRELTTSIRLTQQFQGLYLYRWTNCSE